MKPILLIGFLLLVILIGCSGSQTDSNNLRVEIKTYRVNSWVNLMPGSKPSFFISGSIKIRNNENTGIDSLKLLKCEVRQSGKILYVLHPEFMSSVDPDVLFNPGSDRTYSLNLTAGIPVIKALNYDKLVSVDLYLSAINKIARINIDSIFVVKAY
ncbi:MAG: hypothetical protein P4L35_12355 [Ignavibacteriaceae bacterium]|nr:hypothetical protein [Ignavibacteriaceae bacterium]